MIIKEIWKSTSEILEDVPVGCARCGSPLVELGSEYASVLANIPSTSAFYGKVPYRCQHITCGKVIYAPSRKNPKRKCCF